MSSELDEILSILDKPGDNSNNDKVLDEILSVLNKEPAKVPKSGFQKKASSVGRGFISGAGGILDILHSLRPDTTEIKKNFPENNNFPFKNIKVPGEAIGTEFSTPSEAITQYAKKHIPNLYEDLPANPEEIKENAFYEGVGSALVPLPIPGGNILKAGTAALAKKIPPFLSSMFKQGAIGGGLGYGAETLHQDYNVDKPTAGLIAAGAGIAPLAGKAAISSLKAAPKAISNINPVKMAEKESAKLFSDLDKSKDEILNATEKFKKPVSYEETGNTLKQSLREERDKRRAIAGEKGQKEYSPIDEIKEIPSTDKTKQFIREKLKSYPINDQRKDILRNIMKDLKGQSIKKTGKLKGEKKSKLVTGSDLSELIKKYKNESQKYYAKKDNVKGKLYKDITSMLETEAEAYPEIAKASSEYKKVMQPVNELENHKIFGPLLATPSYKKSQKVIGSEIPEKLLNYTNKGESVTKKLYDAIGSDELATKSIQDYNNNFFWKKVKGENGLIDTKKLNSFTEDYPGIFTWNPDLHGDIKALKRLQKNYDSNFQKIKFKSPEKIPILDEAVKKGLLSAASTYLLGPAVGGAVGAAGAVQGLHKHIKDKSLKNIILKELKDRE